MNLYDLRMWAELYRIAKTENLLLCAPGQDNRGRTAQCYWFDTPEGATAFAQKANVVSSILPMFFYRPDPNMIAIRFAEKTVEQFAHAALERNPN